MMLERRNNMANKKGQSLIQKIKKLRILCTSLLVILLAGAIVLSVGFGVYGMNTADWFKKSQEQTDQALPDNEENDGGNPLIETIECNGIMLLSADEPVVLSDGSITKSLRASVQPDGAVAGFNWSIAFANSSSTWAKGKSVASYMTMTVSDDTQTVDLDCSQAFGEQIIVTCNSSVDSSKSATCTLDYEKRVTGVTISAKEATAGAVSAINFSDDTLKYTFTASPSYGVGTITPTGTTTCTYKFADKFRTAIDSSYTYNDCVDAVKFNVLTTAYDIADTLTIHNYSDAQTIVFGTQNMGWAQYDLSAIKASSYNTTSIKTDCVSKVMSKYKNALKSYSGNVLEFSYSFTSSNGNKYSATKYLAKGTCDFPSLNVTSVSLNSSELVF